MKDFFIMTRNERRGTIVVLALIALILLSTLAVRSCRAEAPVGLVDSAMVQFESDIDSAHIYVKEPASANKSRATKRKSKKKKPSSRPSKPTPAPRRMDPVPQF